MEGPLLAKFGLDGGSHAPIFQMSEENRHVGCCADLDAGDKEAPQVQLTGVQKAPRHEVAGG